MRAEILPYLEKIYPEEAKFSQQNKCESIRTETRETWRLESSRGA